MADIKRYQKVSIPWTAKTLVSSMDKGNSKFDNAVQRSLTWTKEQKSLLIHSMIIGAPIPPLYAAKHGKQYDFIDGKQRSNCIKDFLNNQFRLVDVPKCIDENGDEADYNGMEFQDLPENIQDYIKDYSLTIYAFDEIDDDDFADIFYRINNSTPLKGIEKRIAKMPYRSYIIKMAKHPIFEEALTQRSRDGKTDLDVVIKSLIMLKQNDPALDAKQVNNFARNVELTDEDVERLNKIYDRLIEIHDSIKESNQIMEIKNSIIARRILTKSHMITLVPFIENHIDEPFLKDFIWHFFAGDPNATVSNAYNEASISGSGHREKVKKRQDVLEREYQKYTKDK